MLIPNRTALRGGRVLLLICISAVQLACQRAGGSRPELYLWVWQRSEDLSFVDPADTKLAIWFATITIGQHEPVFEARQNPIRYPSGSEIVAVIRLEANASLAPQLGVKLADDIARFLEPLQAREVQIDFDATESQRVFYAALLAALRSRLPAQRLSITALASWCFGDPWLAELPIDAAVPMYYRLGPGREQIRRYLAEGRQISATICRDNAGYSMDEPDVPWVAAKRVFVFNAQRWSETGVETARRKLEGARSP